MSVPFTRMTYNFNIQIRCEEYSNEDGCEMLKFTDTYGEFLPIPKNMYNDIVRVKYYPACIEAQIAPENLGNTINTLFLQDYQESYYCKN